MRGGGRDGGWALIFQLTFSVAAGREPLAHRFYRQALGRVCVCACAFYPLLWLARGGLFFFFSGIKEAMGWLPYFGVVQGIIIGEFPAVDFVPFG